MSDVDTSAEAVEAIVSHLRRKQGRSQTAGYLIVSTWHKANADIIEALLSERDSLRTQLAEAQKPAPKGYPINLLVSGTIQAHQIADNLGSGKIDKMEPFTRYDAARNALAEARDSALEEAAARIEWKYNDVDSETQEMTWAHDEIRALKTLEPGA